MSAKVLVFVFLATLLQGTLAHGPEPVMEECLKESGATKDAVTAFMKARPMATEDKKIKCYLRCSLTQRKIMTGDGAFLEHTGRPPVPAPMMARMAACKQVKAQDLCEKAFLHEKCVTEVREVH